MEEGEPMEGPMFEGNSREIGNLEEVEEIMLEQPLNMDSLSEEDSGDDDQVIKDHLEMDADMELAMASATCEEKLSTGKDIMEAMMREWCSQVVMYLLLSRAMQQVMRTQWYLLGMHICGSNFQNDQEADLKKEDAYVVDLKNSCAKMVDKEHTLVNLGMHKSELDETGLVMFGDAVEEVHGEFSTMENIWRLGHEKPNDWGANVLMYMLLHVSIQWAEQVQIGLGLMHNEQNDDEGYMDPYDDGSWNMYYEGWLAYMQVADWANSLWPFDPGGCSQ